jgi:hypothetical protein
VGVEGEGDLGVNVGVVVAAAQSKEEGDDWKIGDEERGGLHDERKEGAIENSEMLHNIQFGSRAETDVHRQQHVCVYCKLRLKKKKRKKKAFFD